MKCKYVKPLHLSQNSEKKDCEIVGTIHYLHVRKTLQQCHLHVRKTLQQCHLHHKEKDGCGGGGGGGGGD